MADRYWVGGTANWDGTAGTKWATTSGGAGGAAVPTSADDVFFDAASGSGTVSTVNGYAPVCRNLNFTGFTGTLSLFNSNTANIAVSGGLIIGVGMTIGSGGTAGGFVFVATTDNGGAGWPITTNGKTLISITFNGVGGKWTLQDALTLTTGASFTVTAGHFDSGNYNMLIGRFISSNNNVRTISLGSSVVTLTRDADLSTVGNLTWSTNTAVLRFGTENGISAGTPFDYRGLSLEYTAVGSVGCTLYGSGTFKDLTVVGGATALAFTMNGNPVFTGTVSISGNSSTNRLLVQSNTLGTPRVITAGAVSLTDVDFMDIAIVGPVGSTITSDSFNRADGALGTTDAAAGGSPIAWSFGGQITSNVAVGPSSSTNVVDVGVSDFSASIKMTALPSGGHAGLSVRGNGGTSTRIMFGASNASTPSRLQVINNWDIPVDLTMGLISAGAIMELRVIGSVAVALVNGVVYGAIAIPSTMTVTNNVGITTQPGAQIDDFIVKAMPNVTGTRLGDCLGNSGIEFTTASGTPRDGGGAGVKRYAVAPGNWSDTAMWSESSGGAPGASVPLPQDDVYLDANSAAGTYAVNVPRMGRNIDATGFTRTINHGAISTTALYGSLTRGSGGTYTEVAGNIDFRGRGSHTVTMTTNVASNLNFWSGKYTLLAGFSASGAYNNAVTLSGGTLDLNGQTLNLVNLQTSGTLTKTLIFGAATINMIGSLANIFNLGHANNTVSAEAATINISAVFAADRNFWGGNNEFGALNYTVSDSPGALVISNSNTFGTLNIGSGRSLRLTSGTTQKIGTLNLNGSPRGGVRLPGISGTYLSTPDSAAVSVTGDIDIRVRVAMESWATGNQSILGKWSNALGGGYILFTDTTANRLGFNVYGAGGAYNHSTTTHSFGAGVAGWIRATFRASDGRVQFFTAADSPTMPSSWTQLGTDRMSGQTSIADTATVLEIGSINNGLSGGGSGLVNGAGVFYRAQIRNNILNDGTGIVFDTDFSNQFGPFYTDSSTNGAIVTPITTLANVGDGRVVIESATAGSAATLQVDTVTDMNYVDLKDVVMNGADTYIEATSVIRSNVKGVRRGPQTGMSMMMGV